MGGPCQDRVRLGAIYGLDGDADTIALGKTWTAHGLGHPVLEDRIDRGKHHARSNGTPGYNPLPIHMRLRFYLDSRTGLPHIFGHNVTESEVEQVLGSPGEDRPGAEGARVALGQTDTGRYLRVVYVTDPEPDSVFVITAYTLEGKALTAYKRRRRKKN